MCQADGRQQQAIDFFLALTSAPIPYIAIENPVGIMSSVYRKPDQIIQPWQFGHDTTKRTCLWLKNLPKLIPTQIVIPKQIIYANGKIAPEWHNKTGGGCGDVRSVTYKGIAEAMATQWNIVTKYQPTLFQE